MESARLLIDGLFMKTPGGLSVVWVIFATMITALVRNDVNRTGTGNACCDVASVYKADSWTTSQKEKKPLDQDKAKRLTCMKVWLRI